MKEINSIDWQNLTKKERRQLKREQKRVRREGAVKKNKLTKWGLVLGLMVILGTGFFMVRYLKAKGYENAPKIQITSALHDFGEISASQGLVETSFEVNNIGDSELIISGMETSCGCTTAKLKTWDKESNLRESPEFGMHNNPTNWSTSIEPGTTTKLIVTFDPNFHENTFGPVTRTVSVFSNDPGKSEEKVTILANVIQ